ncbi:MAG: M4 family metallopeptidase [Lachnospiraceae bacterium]|nr:M4 family metallopeptidase [Lachnospiraceae bacterium]
MINGKWRRFVGIILCISLLSGLVFTGCGSGSGAGVDKSGEKATEAAKAGDSPRADQTEEEDETAEDETEEEPVIGGETPEVQEESLTGEGAVVSFIGEPFYEGVENEDDALEAVYSVLDYVGGDQSTQLELAAIDGPTEEGNNIYTFRQMAGDVVVFGATAKLIVDSSGQAIGLVSDVVPGLRVDEDASWRIDETEAEAVVKAQGKEEGIDYRVIPNVTEQTLLPFEDDSTNFYYAWVVYTHNVYDDVDTAYLAHYVDEAGKYLYAIPVTQPGNSEALSGSTSIFAFDGMDEAEWSGTVTKHTGETEDITIPVAADPETGDIYLGDVKRKVICADYADFIENDTLTPRVAENEQFDNNEVQIYRAFLEVYDFFEGIGWHGPDGAGSPVVILMDWVDENGDTVHNACYSGKMQGFDVFMFNKEDPDGECYDTMAHEFTHALTTATMTYNIYKNDYGAINEALSDIFGNLAEALMEKTDDEEWLIQENGENVIRSMSNPNQYGQPGYTWDQFYVPEVEESSERNDNGGVHTNSSLLNLIAYRLNESGMDPVDQLYYWQHVAMIITPKTDYSQMAEILPWTLQLIGMEDYRDVLLAAIDETGIRDGDLPDEPGEGLARFQLTFPVHDFLDSYEVFALAFNIEDNAQYYTWPEVTTDLMAATVEPGVYIFELQLVDRETDEEYYVFWQGDGWVLLSAEDNASLLSGDASLPDDCFINMEAGEVAEFDTSGLAEIVS